NVPATPAAALSARGSIRMTNDRAQDGHVRHRISRWNRNSHREIGLRATPAQQRLAPAYSKAPRNSAAGGLMRYALLIYGRAAAPTEKISDTVATVLGRPQVTAWARLQPDETAATLRSRDGEMLVTDGPFIDSKEYLAGIIVIDVDSLDQAMEVARQAEGARESSGAIEVRPIIEGFFGGA
ncbi:MAG TPA: YciI family protein, partial [Acidiphilium sp.]